MTRTIGITDLPRGVRGVVDEVAGQKTSVVLTRGKHPEAAIIPYEDYLRYQEMRESETLMHFHETRTRHARMGSHLGDE